MFPVCLVIGDSTAVGTASALASQGIHCEVRAKVGATSSRALELQPSTTAADQAVIAIGSNDPANPVLEQNLRRLRVRIASRRVAWIVPYEPHAASIVTSVAVTFGDDIVPLSRYATRDRVHPASYLAVAQGLRMSFRPSVQPAPLSEAKAIPTRPVSRRAVVMTF